MSNLPTLLAAILEPELDSLIADNLRIGEKADDPLFERSVLQALHYPILVRVAPGKPGYWLIVDGHSRVRVYVKARRKTIRAIEVQGDLTPEQVRAIQLRIDAHRKGLTDHEKAVAVAAIAASEPGKSQKQIAEELSLDETLVCKLLKAGIPPVEAAFAEGLPLLKRYEIARYPEDQQEEKLREALGGATVQELARGRKKAEPSERAPKLKIPMPEGAVVVTGRGDIDLPMTEELLLAALKAVRDAQKKGLSAKTFARAMSDMAAK